MKDRRTSHCMINEPAPEPNRQCMVKIPMEQQMVLDEVWEAIKSAWKNNSSIVGLEPPSKLRNTIISIFEKYNQGGEIL